MNNNFCTECGTENEEKYLYCKNCGTPLKKTNNNNQNNAAQANNADYSQPQFNGQYAYNNANVYNTPKGFVLNSIDGIPQEEVAMFIGKKAYDIMPKFSKMELTGSKTSWCWPAAILGYLFGPFGAAIWFFYRKMYKPAIILSVIGAVLTAIVAFMTFGTVEIDFESLVNAISAGDADGVYESLVTNETLLGTLGDLFSELAHILTCILCGLFGYKFYKEHCVNKIRNFKVLHSDYRYYQLGLSSIGGVSGGMLAVGILIMICVENAATIISTVISNI